MTAPTIIPIANVTIIYEHVVLSPDDMERGSWVIMDFEDYYAAMNEDENSYEPEWGPGVDGWGDY